MWDRPDEKLVIFKTEAVLSPWQIAQPVMTSKQIKIPKDKTVSVMGTVPSSARGWFPEDQSFCSLLVTLDVS